MPSHLGGALGSGGLGLGPAGSLEAAFFLGKGRLFLAGLLGLLLLGARHVALHHHLKSRG